MLNSTACCFPPLPILVVGNAFLDETYSLCVKLRNGSTVPQWPQCAGCNGFATLESCERECVAHPNCSLFQFEPLVEYFHVANNGKHQCAYNCAVQGLEQRVCTCGKCSLFAGNATAQQTPAFNRLQCSDFEQRSHLSQCGAHGPSVCRRANVSAGALSPTTTSTAATTSPNTTTAALKTENVSTGKTANAYVGIWIALGLIATALLALALFVLCLVRRQKPNQLQEQGIELQTRETRENTYEEPVAWADA